MSLTADELINEIHEYFDTRLDYEPETETSMTRLHSEQLDDEIARIFKESPFTIAPIHDVIHTMEEAIKLLDRYKIVMRGNDTNG